LALLSGRNDKSPPRLHATINKTAATLNQSFNSFVAFPYFQIFKSFNVQIVLVFLIFSHSRIPALYHSRIVFLSFLTTSIQTTFTPLFYGRF
ncbi:MAG: hypothetical protein LC658_16140, partial [Bacteroidales bacterium]|nr:hypothetical protein [Bacteroidales bacterium]